MSLTDMKPTISVITPCYKLGLYLKETIESVEALPDGLYEHIIVDDCSPDQETIDIIKDLQANPVPHRKVFRNEKNQELATTLNRGIEQASGQYIVVLSADDKLIAENLLQALEILQQSQQVDVVYGNSILFGAQTGELKSKPFNLQLLLIDNYINASALYPRKMWEEVGGYDANAPFIAVEDWDFWLSAVQRGYRFQYIDLPLINYRILHSSKTFTTLRDKRKANRILDYLYGKHRGFTGAAELDGFLIKTVKHNPIGFCIKWMLKAYFPGQFNKLCEKGKLRKYL